MVKGGDSRGLSTIVATLLVILLTLVAVGIIWVVVRNVINQGAEQVSLGKFTLNLEIKSVGIDPATPNFFSLRIKRNAGAGEINGLKFIVDDGDTTEVVELNNYSMKELEERVINISLSSITNASNVKTVSVAPIFKLESGKEVTGDVKDEYDVPKTSVSSGSVCTPVCTGRNCGSNGCGGICGTCSSGYTCQISNGTCMINACTPATCAGKVCGSWPNGTCSGTLSCGTCPSGTCNSSGQCEISAPSWQNGMVSWWRFNGNANDYFKLNNGTVNGATLTSTNCKSGQCYNFDGISDNINAGNRQSLRSFNAITLVAWVKFESLDYSGSGGNLMSFMGKGNIDDGSNPHSAFWFSYDNRDNGNLFDYCAFGNTAGGYDGGDNNFKSISYTFNNNIWYMIAVTIDSSSLGKLFVNGNQVGSSVQFINLDLSNSVDDLLIGQNIYNYYFDGSLDEMMIFNRSLSSTEISQIYSYSYP